MAISPLNVPLSDESDKTGRGSILPEERYRRFFETAMDGVLILDADTGEVVDANPFLMDLLGYSLPELLGMKLWEIGPLRDIAASEKAFAELQAKDYIRYENLPLETKDGVRREVEFVSSACQVEGMRFIQCNIRDITKRKRDDVERNRLADVLDERCLNEIYFYDAETLRFSYVNKGGRQNLGSTLAQLREMTVLDIQPEFDAASFRRMVGPLLRKEEALHVFQTTQRRADATLYPVEVHLQLVDQQGIQLLLAVTLDITARLDAELALRESEERYRLLVEGSPDAIFVHCEGRIAFANPATLLLFGAERPEQVIGRDIMEIMHPDSRAAIEERSRNAVAGGKAPAMEQKLVRLDGAIVEVEAMDILSVYDGKPAIQVILRDITEKKQMEAQALRSQRMESIGSLAAGIAHDLNNALAPILMANELLRTGADPKTNRMLDIIEESAQHGADLVKQVLTFARGAKEERTVMDIAPLIEELSAIARHTFRHSIQLVTSVPADTWAFVGDPTQLHQVLLNLFVNARDAMPKGGLLTVAVANIQIDVNHEGIEPPPAKGPYIRITVADSGTGMSDEVQSHIFDPFYTTKAPGKGTGLGLSTVRAIIEAHHGFLRLDSKLGHGTKFHVHLPAQIHAQTAPADSSTGAVPPMGRGELILLVDDEAAIRTILAETLRTCGYRVVVASDGPQAVALFAQNPERFRLLITDMDMPMMDGAATIMAIRSILPNVKVIATSGTRSSIATNVRLHAQAFLQKPYTSDELLLTIQDVLYNDHTTAAHSLV